MLPLVNFPGTDLKLSPLGLGTVKFGRNSQVKYPTSFNLPTDEEIENLLALCKDYNINLLDTAPAYGISEQRLGNFLQKDNFFKIMTKAGEEFIDGKSKYDYSQEAITKSVERSLKRLNRESLEIVLIHSNGDDIKIIENFQAFETLDKLKKRGLIQHYGMSTKTVAGGKLSISNSDITMLTINLAYREEVELLQYAKELNKAIVLKKIFASGNLTELKEKSPIEASFKFLKTLPNIASMILGTINPKHLRENVETYVKVKDC